MSIIEFPRLGLEFGISRIAFEVFGLPIYWYGVIIALSFALAVFLGMRKCKDYGIDPENILDLVLFAVPAAVIAARLYYVIFSWNDFRDNFLEIFNTRNGGLAIYGAVIGALAAAFVYTKVKKIDTLNLIDFCAPYLIMAQAIGRWGNFINQEAFGVNTGLPWGMTGTGIRQEIAAIAPKLAESGIVLDPTLPVHPAFLYESLWNFAAFAFLIWFRKRKKLKGEAFMLYIILYGIGRAWIEPLRTDSLMFGSFRISQLIAVITAVIFIGIFIWRRVLLRSKNAGDYSDIEIGNSDYGSVLKNLQSSDEQEKSDGSGESVESSGSGRSESE